MLKIREMLPLKVIYLYDLSNFLYTTFITVFPREDLTFRLLILSMGVLLQWQQIFFCVILLFLLFKTGPPRFCFMITIIEVLVRRDFWRSLVQTPTKSRYSTSTCWEKPWL